MRLHRLLLLAAAATALAGVAPPLGAEPVPVDAQDQHPNGSSLRVRAVEVMEDAVRVDITVTTAAKEIRLNRSGSMVLEGEGDARHRLVPPDDNEEVKIPPNSRLTGEMVFSGRPVPGARRLTLSTNENVGGSEDNQYTELPTFRVAVPLPDAAAPAGTSAAGTPVGEPAVAAVPPGAASAPLRLTVDRQDVHPNGAVMTVATLEGTEDGTAVVLRVSTAGKEIRLNRSSSLRLTDDRGNSYRAVPPADNPEFRLPRNSRVEARVLFSGRIDPAAATVTLTSNEDVGGSADSQYTELPVFRISIPLRQG